MKCIAHFKVYANKKNEIGKQSTFANQKFQTPKLKVKTSKE